MLIILIITCLTLSLVGIWCINITQIDCVLSHVLIVALSWITRLKILLALKSLINKFYWWHLRLLVEVRHRLLHSLLTQLEEIFRSVLETSIPKLLTSTILIHVLIIVFGLIDSCKSWKGTFIYTTTNSWHISRERSLHFLVVLSWHEMCLHSIIFGFCVIINASHVLIDLVSPCNRLF